MRELVKTAWEAQERAIIVVLLLFVGVIILRTAWVCDDAYISFRTVDNFVNGYGLTWNTGERVQSFTNPLWVLVMSAFYLFSGEVYYTSIFLSLVLSLTAMAVVAFRASVSVWRAALAVTILVSSKAFMDYSTSGLENPLNHLLLALFLTLYFTREHSVRSFFWLSLIAALGTLTRMDTVLLYLPVLLVLFIKLPKSRALRAGLLAFSPFIAWEFFSIIYYGFPFPNTYYAKLQSGLPLWGYLSQGLLYYLECLHLDPLTLFVIFGTMAVTITTKDKRSWPVQIGIIIYLLYVVRVGGDFMAGRFFAAPLLCSVVLLSRMRWPDTTVARWLPIGLVIVIGLMSPFSPILSDKTYGDDKHYINEKGIADERGWYYKETGLLTDARNRPMPDHVWAEDGRAAKLDTVGTRYGSTVGMLGFYGGPDIHWVEDWALTEPLLARLPSCEGSNWRVGHLARRFPVNYFTTLETGENTISDPNLAIYYEKLKYITQGDIWSIERFKAICLINTGGYDYLLELYKTAPIRLTYDQICEPKSAGTVWNVEGNTVFNMYGLHISFAEYRHEARLEISVDHNDEYDLMFFRDSTELESIRIASHWIKSRGLRIDTLAVPAIALEEGYNRLEIYPAEGDGKFSIGHVLILENGGE